MAGDSYAARTEDGLHFRVPKMVKAAQELVGDKDLENGSHNNYNIMAKRTVLPKVEAIKVDEVRKSGF